MVARTRARGMADAASGAAEDQPASVDTAIANPSSKMDGSASERSV